MLLNGRPWALFFFIQWWYGSLSAFSQADRVPSQIIVIQRSQPCLKSFGRHVRSSFYSVSRLLCKRSCTVYSGCMILSIPLLRPGETYEQTLYNTGSPNENIPIITQRRDCYLRTYPHNISHNVITAKSAWGVFLLQLTTSGQICGPYSHKLVSNLANMPLALLTSSIQYVTMEINIRLWFSLHLYDWSLLFHFFIKHLCKRVSEYRVLLGLMYTCKITKTWIGKLSFGQGAVCK